MLPASDLLRLRLVRVAFPKYIDRPPFYNKATLTANGKTEVLELTEDVNAVARRSLQDRMALEIVKGIGRLAVKQASGSGRS